MKVVVIVIIGDGVESFINLYTMYEAAVLISLHYGWLCGAASKYSRLANSKLVPFVRQSVFKV